MQANSPLPIEIALMFWVCCLILRISLGPRLTGQKLIFQAYLTLNLLFSMAFCLSAFTPTASWIQYLTDSISIWIAASALAMFTIPLRLVPVPNAYVFGLFAYNISSFASIEAGNDPSNFNLEILVFGLVLAGISLTSLLRLNGWWHVKSVPDSVA